MTDMETGDLQIVDVSSAGECYDKLEVGKNVLSASASFDASSLYSRYVVLGQKSGVDTDFGKGASESKGIIDSSFFKRNRLLVLKEKGQSTKQTCGQRATFEKKYREAYFRSAIYRLQGWRQADGSIWNINTEVQIIDPIIGDQTALVSKIVFTLDSSGMKTELSVIQPEGYKRDPFTPKQEAKISTNKAESNKWKGVVK